MASLIPFTRRRPARGLSVAVVLVAAAGVAVAAATAAAHTRIARGAVQLHETALGAILVDARGRTLYMYTVDRHGKSACYGGCASAWPPLLTRSRKPALGEGVHRNLLGVTRRTNGALQITYRGHPLYRFAGDAKAGALNGQGYGRKWYVLHANGVVVRKMTAASAQPATTTSGGSGWG